MTYTPMTTERLAGHLADEHDPDLRWRLLLEFLEEYQNEPAQEHPSLVEVEPPTTGDDQWDALLAGIAEWLAAQGGGARPYWPTSTSPFAAPNDHGAPHYWGS